MSKTVRIVGAGFSGLSLGYFLTKLGIPVHIFEKSNRVGGMIATKKEPWGISETAATGYLNSQLFESVMNDLGLKCAERTPGFKKRFVFRNGNPSRFPLNPLETLRFTAGAGLALMGFAKPKERESMRHWGESHLGRAAFNYLVGPALQGIYASQDLDAELVLNSMNRKSNFEKPKISGTRAPLGGMQELTDGLARKITELGGKIDLNIETDLGDLRPVVLAVPAKTAAVLLAADYPELAKELARVDYLPVTTVSAMFGKNEPHLYGFGCLFPQSEGFHALGVLVNSCLFSNRGSRDTVLETWIFSGVGRANILQELQQDRMKLLDTEKSTLLHADVTEWPNGIPHYNHELQAFTKNYNCPPGVYLTGNYLGAIGLAKVLENNYFLAMKIAENKG